MMKLLLLSLAIVGLLAVALPIPAHAYNALSPSCSGAAATSAVCNRSTTNNISGSDGVIAHITNIVAYVAGAAAVILIIISGIRYILSGGDSNKVSSAKGTMIGAIIGLVVIVLARALINFVLGKL